MNDVEARVALERGPATNYVPDVRNRRVLMAHADAYAKAYGLWVLEQVQRSSNGDIDAIRRSIQSDAPKETS